MNKLKAGDRVRVYHAIFPFIGEVEYVEKEAVRIKKDKTWYHYKQCRKLKPKAKPREWYCVLRNETSWSTPDGKKHASANFYCSTQEEWAKDRAYGGKIIKMREVK